MSIKISSCAGHSNPPGDPGAVGSVQSKPLLNGQTEAILARNMNTAFIAEGKKRGYEMHDATQANGSPTAQATAANKFGANLSVTHHFNGSTSPTTSGVMILIHPNTSQANKNLAKDLASGIAKAFGIPNLGVVTRADLGFLNLTNAPAIYFEWAYISSPTDMQKVLPVGMKGILAAWDVIAKYYPIKKPVEPVEPPKPVEPKPVPPKETEEYKALLSDYNALVKRYKEKEMEYNAVENKLHEVGSNLNVLSGQVQHLLSYVNNN